MKRVLIAGQYGMNAAEDGVAVAGMIHQLCQRGAVTCTVMSDSPRDAERFFGTEAVSWRDIGAVNDAVRTADLVVLGGLIHEGRGIDSRTPLTRDHGGVAVYATGAWLAELHGRPLVTWGVRTGPLRAERSVEHVAMVVERSWAMSVRDEASRRHLERAGLSTENVVITGDPAFLIEGAKSTPRRRRELDDTERDASGPRLAVALAVDGKSGDEDPWISEMAAAVDRWLLETQGRVVVFAPLAERTDATRRALDRLEDRLNDPSKCTWIEAGLTPAQRMEVMAACDAVIGTHPGDVIPAVLAGVPVVGVDGGTGVAETMEELGLSSMLVSGRGLKAEDVADCLRSACETRSSLVGQASHRAAELRRFCLRDVDVVRRALDGELQGPAPPSARVRSMWRRSVVELALRVERERAMAEQLRAENEILAGRVAALVEQNAKLVWRAKTRRRRERKPPLARRSYYAAARAIRKLVRWRTGAVEGTGATSPLFAARFHRYLDHRRSVHAASLAGLRCPSRADLVTVVLPVFNGEDLITEAIESVLGQTYERLELIIVDDGSTDGTAEIAHRFAEADDRVTVVRQDHRNLPSALSNGFRHAVGQYLTWTSHDNRLKPHFLERMVDCLARHPDWDMAYANFDLIDEEGAFLEGSPWYYRRQVPAGSCHVHLPTSTSELNTWPNNTIGAAFLYRDRVAALLGDYCRDRMTVEDYDYWMLVNEFLSLEHADVEEPLYEYRFHPRSLTALKDDEDVLARRERVMVFDDFRRDFALAPLVWLFRGFPASGRGREVRTALERRARGAGHLVLDVGRTNPERWPSLWFPTVRVWWADDPDEAAEPGGGVPRETLEVLLSSAERGLPSDISADWSLCITIGSDPELRSVATAFVGWHGLSDIDELFTAIDIRARTQQFKAIEAELRHSRRESLEATVVVATFRRRDALRRALVSVARQTMERQRFEIVVVNNDPDVDVGDVVSSVRDELFPDHGEHLRLIDCPLRGLAHARNAGIGVARGRIVAFLDDDAIAEPSWLETLLSMYEMDPDVGVVGGRITLSVPEEAPDWITPDLWALWGHLEPPAGAPRIVDEWHALPWGGNWSARRSLLLAIGGFRCGYGRSGDDYGGGEEIVAGMLAQRLGARIVMHPGASVRHEPDVDRFTRKYVEETIRAGALVGYRLQRDLYIPEWQRPLDLMMQIVRRAGRILLRPGGPTGARIERRARLRADWQVFRAMVADAFYKSRFVS